MKKWVTREGLQMKYLFRYGPLSVLLVIGFSWFFYRSWFACIPFTVLGVLYYKKCIRDNREREKRELLLQFKECIQSISTALYSGYSMENSMGKAKEDMILLYGQQSRIYQELEKITRGISLGQQLEELLIELGNRSELEEIKQFASIYSIARYTGGNLNAIIRQTSLLISEHIETCEEIKTSLSGKILEQKIMRCMPFGLYFYVGYYYPGYFDSFYGNQEGIVLMTVLLGIYLFSNYVGERTIRNIMKELEGEYVIQEDNLTTAQHGGVQKPFYYIARRIYWMVGLGKGKGVIPQRVKIDLKRTYPELTIDQLLELFYIKKIAMVLEILAVGVLFILAKPMYGVGVAFVALAVALLVYFLLDYDLHKIYEKRKRVWKGRYPDILQQCLLYMGAGLSIRATVERLAQKYTVFRYVQRELQSGMLEVVCYERFGQRMEMKEYVQLSALFIQQQKRGNQYLLERLEQEAFISMRERLKYGKRLGEEADPKLLISTIGLLSMVMILIMMPAFSIML